jgi:hypothetical protein
MTHFRGHTYGEIGNLLWPWALVVVLALAWWVR